MWQQPRNPVSFLFECTEYTDLRRDLFTGLNWLPNNTAVNLNLLLNGSNELLQDENEMIFTNVYEFIKKSKRFLVV